MALIITGSESHASVVFWGTVRRSRRLLVTMTTVLCPLKPSFQPVEPQWYNLSPQTAREKSNFCKVVASRRSEARLVTMFVPFVLIARLDTTGDYCEDDVLGPMLPFNPDDEDLLLSVMITRQSGSGLGFKLTPSYLLQMCIS